MILNIVPSQVSGLTASEVSILQDLLQIYTAHSPKNAEKDKYYEGKISLASVNLGIALPDGLNRLEIGCAWGAKCVDVLAARSMFDGYVGLQGEDVEELDRLVVANNLIDSVKYKVEKFTGLDVANISVFVEGVRIID